MPPNSTLPVLAITQFPITSADNNKWVCFRVKDSNNIYGYAQYQIDFNGPTVTVVQDQTTITASTTATDLPDTPVWKKSPVQTSDPTCKNIADNLYTAGKTVTAVATDHGKHYCFKVTDKQGNAGYGKIKVKVGPTITISQTQTTITASATPILGTVTATSWENFQTTNDQQPNCQTSTSYGIASSSANTISSITAADNNEWVCFKVKDSIQ